MTNRIVPIDRHTESPSEASRWRSSKRAGTYRRSGWPKPARPASTTRTSSEIAAIVATMTFSNYVNIMADIDLPKAPNLPSIES
jgi:hypothetical protein